MNPKVAIVILNWNGKEDTIECLESLKHITYPNYEILLVDNGSTDGSVECFRERYPGMEIIENGENLGFAEGNNVGIRRVMDEGADYVLLLNNDTVVDPEFLGELVKVAEGDERIGIVGSKIYIYGSNVLDSAGSIYTNIGSCKSRGHLEEDNGKYDEQEEVAMITACCMLIRNEILNKTYLFDSSFFMYLEEFDFTIRARQLEYKIFYNPKSIVYHKFSKSVQTATTQVVLFKQLYEERNRSKILMVHYPLKILARNIHLILMSFLWWQYYFLRFGGIRWFFKLNLNISKSFIIGVYCRIRSKNTTTEDWTKWMTTYGIIDYLHLKNNMMKNYKHTQICE